MKKTLMICSNGALKGTLSGGAWVLAGDKGEIFAIGINPDTAHVDFQISYRSEIQAGIASILFIVCLCKYFQIQTPSILHYCANKAFVNKIKI